MIKELSSLRGIFILFIFLHHMSVFPGGGGMGVAFFFVLGGFSMTVGYFDRINKPSFCYKDYLLRRVVKFYPLHWLCLLAAIPLVLDSFNWITFGVNAALLHSWIPKGEFYFSYNAVSWYLANTMFFAVVFPLLFRCFAPMSKNKRLLWGIIVASIYICLSIITPDNHRHGILYIHPLVRLCDFIVGILAGLFFLKIKNDVNTKVWMEHRSRVAKLLLIVAMFVLVVEAAFLPDKHNYIAVYYWLFILVVIIVSSLLGSYGYKTVLQNKYLVKFGEYSFPFFLLHQIVIRYVYQFIRPSLCLLTENRYVLQVLLIVVCFIFTLFFTVIIQNYLNKPFTQWLTKKILPSTVAQ